ncbi:hypothetical protein WMF30_23010 [Sorangium sp. So ce134]
MSLVLRDPAPCEELKQLVSRVLLHEVKPKLGLFFHYEQCIERAPGVIVHVWWEPLHPKLDVRLVCDDLMRTTYINVTGPDAEVRRRLLDELAAHVDLVPVEELREAVRRDGGDGSAWLRLALGLREEFDAEAFALIRGGLASPDLAQRHGAAQAVALLEWPQLAQPVREALAREGDPNTAQLLELAAQVTA